MGIIEGPFQNFVGINFPPGIITFYRAASEIFDSGQFELDPGETGCQSGGDPCTVTWTREDIFYYGSVSNFEGGPAHFSLHSFRAYNEYSGGEYHAFGGPVDSLATYQISALGTGVSEIPSDAIPVSEPSYWYTEGAPKRLQHYYQDPSGTWRYFIMSGLQTRTNVSASSGLKWSDLNGFWSNSQIDDFKEDASGFSDTESKGGSFLPPFAILTCNAIYGEEEE